MYPWFRNLLPRRSNNGALREIDTKGSRPPLDTDGDFSDHRFGRFRTTLNRESHSLQIWYRDSDGEERGVFARFKIDPVGTAGDRVIIRDVEVCKSMRRAGWGTEGIKELQRRFPSRRVQVDDAVIEPRPDAVGFWNRSADRGLLRFDDREKVDRRLRAQHEAPYSVYLANYCEVATPEPFAVDLMEEYRDARNASGDGQVKSV